MIREKAYPGINGYLMLVLLLGAIAAGIYGVLRAIPADNGLRVVLWILLVVVAAAMVSNLLVVLCGDRAAVPVVNAGTLYQ